MVVVPPPPPPRGGQLLPLLWGSGKNRKRGSWRSKPCFLPPPPPHFKARLLSRALLEPPRPPSRLRTSDSSCSGRAALLPPCPLRASRSHVQWAQHCPGSGGASTKSRPWAQTCPVMAPVPASPSSAQVQKGWGCHLCRRSEGHRAGHRPRHRGTGTPAIHAWVRLCSPPCPPMVLAFRN